MNETSRFKIPSRKLENVILELNQNGYRVTHSTLSGDNLILTVEKINLQAIKELSLESISEDNEKHEYKKPLINLNSIWNGLRMRWLSF